MGFLGVPKRSSNSNRGDLHARTVTLWRRGVGAGRQSQLVCFSRRLDGYSGRSQAAERNRIDLVHGLKILDVVDENIRYRDMSHIGPGIRHVLAGPLQRLFDCASSA